MYNQPSHEMKWESKPIIYFYYLSSKRLKELYKQKFWFTFHLIALWSKVVFSVVPSYGVVPGEAQFKKEVGLPSWFSTVVCQGWCVRGLGGSRVSNDAQDFVHP